MAQYQLGAQLFKGDSISQDYHEAIRWYRKAADQDHAGGQLGLGLCHANGWGTPKDNRAAANWYKKAADQQDAQAQYQLGLAYAGGLGVPKDAVEAYKWFNLSAAIGIEDAKRLRTVLEAELTQEQIAEGQKLSREFKPQ